MLVNIILIIAWVIFSIFEGRREAWYFHEKYNSKSVTKNIHYYFSIQRICVYFGFLFGFIREFEINFITNIITITVILGCQFVFWHDGFYYLERNNLNSLLYPKRFRDFKNSNAIFDFTWNQRKVLFITSILWIIAVKILENLY